MMTYAVRYYTRSGNTEKLAGAIARAVDVEAKDLSAPLDEKVDLLFLGSSYYAFDVDEAVKAYITENRAKIGKIVCFGTSAMMRSVRKPVGKVAKPLGLTVAEEEFHCRGSFGPAHKGRPNEKDLAAAAAFARNLLK